MPWLRIGDNVSTHPNMSKLLASTKLDHAQKNEAFGVLVQMAAVSAAHLTNGIIELGLLAQIAPGRERLVLELLKKTGVATEEELNGRTVISLQLDDEEFLHIRRKEEIEQDRNRAKDKRTPGLLAQVRVRDGDSCRWCGKSVSWKNRSGYRAATYDSLTHHKDSSVDSLVVSCKSCNSKRGNGEELNLIPAPERPIYGQQTVDFVNSDTWCRDNGIYINLTEPMLPIKEAKKAADTNRSAHDGARWETGAPEPADNDEEPEWVNASPERMAEIMAGAADTNRSAHDGARWETGAPADHDTHRDQPTPETAADTNRSAHDGARWETRALSKDNDCEHQAPKKAADTNRSAHDGARWETGAPDTDATPPENLGRDPGRSGDEARNVGSGRDGSGRPGSAKRSGKRKRRGKRGGRG